MCWVFKRVVRKAFSLSLPSLGLFSARRISQLARAVGLEYLTASGPGCCPVSQLFQVSVASDDTRMTSSVSSIGVDKVCSFLLVVTCSCVFSLGSCSEPQESEYIWITINLLWITILKSTPEFGHWTSIRRQKNYKVQENCTQHRVVVPLQAQTENREALHAEELSFVKNFLQSSWELCPWNADNTGSTNITLQFKTSWLLPDQPALPLLC